MVKTPINNGIIIILGGAGFCPSTVSFFLVFCGGAFCGSPIILTPFLLARLDVDFWWILYWLNSICTVDSSQKETGHIFNFTIHSRWISSNGTDLQSQQSNISFPHVEETYYHGSSRQNWGISQKVPRKVTAYPPQCHPTKKSPA